MLFGTDGIRGHSSSFSESRLAYNVAKVLVAKAARKMRIIIARDTRTSGVDIEAEFLRGLEAFDVEVVLLGVVPTPVLAFMVVEKGADYGIMISASHNPPEYNGLKIFGSNGQKITLEEESEITDAFYKLKALSQDDIDEGAGEISDKSICESTGKVADKSICESTGKVADKNICGTADKAIGERAGKEVKAKKIFLKRQVTYSKYIAYLKKRLGDEDFLEGQNIKLDCCYGATVGLARLAFEAFGANVEALAEEFDGAKINMGTGSTNMDFIADNMKKCDDIGFAFDGDGDRVLGVVADGSVIDGDLMVYVLAMYFKSKGMLQNNAAVGTLMTNMGMENQLAKQGITIIRTDVGDKYVIEKMREGYIVGGENSGHIILGDSHVGQTGDGILAALSFCKALGELGIKLQDAKDLYKPFPQNTINIKATKEQKQKVMTSPSIKNLKVLIEEDLGDRGRILLRPSGTEDKIRVMVEAVEQSLVDDVLEILVVAINKNIAGEL